MDWDYVHTLVQARSQNKNRERDKILSDQATPDQSGRVERGVGGGASLGQATANVAGREMGRRGPLPSWCGSGLSGLEQLG